MKREIVRRFLEFTGRYVALSELRIASLGGQGWEFGVWKELSIPEEHGWIIERNRRATRELIKRFSYRYCPRLSLFPRVLERSSAGNDYLDALHLDLCGTLEPNFDEVKPVVSLVASQAHGRCLAVTVADARRNRALEAFSDVRSGLARLVGGPEVDRFLAHLVQEQRALRPASRRLPAFMQPADPEKCARRELGLFWQLIRLLTYQGRDITAIPDCVERYIYVSRYQRSHPFRMRTYFFHFDPVGTVGNTAAVVRKMMVRWQASRLEFLRKDILTVPEAAQEVPMAIVSTEEFSHLASLARAAGGACQQEFDELMRRLRLMPAAEHAYVVLAEFFGKPAVSSRAQPTVPVVGVSEQSSADNTNHVTVGAQVELIRSAAAHNGRPSEECYTRVRRLLGLNGRAYAKVFRRKLGGYYATTQGKFRPSFMRRAVGALGPAVLEELAPLYARIAGEPITVATLKAEAEL